MRVFVSHAGRDLAWAEWIAWQLDQAGVVVELDSWDWQAGDNFVAKMNTALATADAMVAVFSQAYFEPTRWTSEEWYAAFQMAKQRPRFLLPVRIDDTPAPPLLAGLIAAALHDKPAEPARQVLLGAVLPAGRRGQEPAFPGGTYPPRREGAAPGPRLPGVLPAVWGDVPARNEAFTGRDAMLVRLREGLRGSGRSVVHALSGAGGVGKTQLAGEYVWRFANDYDAVWWVNAEQTDLIGEQFAAFAVALDLVDAAETVGPAVLALRRYCRTRERWLIVLDNATSAVDINPWILPGPGHVLLSSRDPTGWPEVAAALSVDVFNRAESIALFLAHLPTMPDTDADRLAKALGDLPLALAQAAGVLAEGMRPAQYLDLLATSAVDVLGEGVPPSYPVPLAAAVTMAVDQLSAIEPAATQLARLCAVLAPEPIPVDWFIGLDDGVLPVPLADIARAPLAFRRVLRLLSRYGVAKVDAQRDVIVLHRLTQHIIRDHTPADDRSAITATVSSMLASLGPNQTHDPASWPVWAELLPHLRTLDLSGTDDPALAWTAGRAADYLMRRGDTRASHELAQQLYLQWSAHLGIDHQHTRWAASYLAQTLRNMSRHHEALELDQRSYTRCQAELGDDHPETLRSATNLAHNLRALGEHQRARELNEDTLTRRRRILGDDNRLTSISANDLALDLSALGEHRKARELHEDTLTRRRRNLGDDHPDTLNSANNLANTLSALDEHQQARELHEDTLTRRRRILGDDHPQTLSSANNLATDLEALGQRGDAQRWRAWAAGNRNGEQPPDPSNP